MYHRARAWASEFPAAAADLPRLPSGAPASLALRSNLSVLPSRTRLLRLRSRALAPRTLSVGSRGRGASGYGPRPLRDLPEELERWAAARGGGRPRPGGFSPGFLPPLGVFRAPGRPWALPSGPSASGVARAGPGPPVAGEAGGAGPPASRGDGRS